MISHKVTYGVRETDLPLENSIDCCTKYKLFRTKEPSRRVLPAIGVYHRHLLDLSHDAYVRPYPGPAPYACMQTPYASSVSRNAICGQNIVQATPYSHFIRTTSISPDRHPVPKIAQTILGLISPIS